MTLSVAFIAEGDATTADCWSGSGRSFVEALRGAGARVDVYDASLRSWRRTVAAVLSYHPTRARWRQRYGLGTVSFDARTRQVNRALTTATSDYDAVIQVGATFSVSKAARRGASHVVYCDSNLAYAWRGAPYSAASRLDHDELEAALRRERRVYHGADRIWTMSDALAHSFREDFALPTHRIATIYAGANHAPAIARIGARAPRILFVGKDHERKGSAVLLAAFARVRRAIPDAELHLVGGFRPKEPLAGVVAHGFVSRSTAEGVRLLDELFGSASVYCMPSRYEPFGIAFVEAMHAGLPCVGTTSWAMPELIDHGVTGWLVPDGAVEELANVLTGALREPERSARMGERARARARARFTWERVAAHALTDLRQLRLEARSVAASVAFVE